jgi:hypothetical protein
MGRLTLNVLLSFAQFEREEETGRIPIYAIRLSSIRALLENGRDSRAEDRMDAKQIIAAKLAEWGLTLSDAELAQLVPAQENLLRWQSVLEEMLHSRKIADGMSFPESEPIVIHALEKKGGPR